MAQRREEVARRFFRWSRWAFVCLWVDFRKLERVNSKIMHSTGNSLPEGGLLDHAVKSAGSQGGMKPTNRHLTVPFMDPAGCLSASVGLIEGLAG